ncbi:hypothetical protein RSO68_00285 [Halomonas saccharevitans]|uniref:Toxin CptA n=1 Tax=Halomonas saccharevitans TaxID=416872 RepID=A0A1I7A6L0_9GAMM|nr:hypothetical protein [Halomonas saccharevitans]MDT8877904.1 hypothetical protein [Halomonas saccharevitans]SFT70569.1 hypothetical protein SAMN04487956_11557 [Halomonas saccharevitans]
MVAGLVSVAAATWAGALAVCLLAGTLALMARDRRSGQLRLTPTAAGETSAAWRDHVDEAWRPVSLRCDYLGPWLIGLWIEGRRLWLWPDSSDPEALRRLRRELLPLP